MRGVLVERCSTGIEGFDIISQGGFVKNSTNVLIGGPGSGKTTFILQFLYNGATKFNEPGLYCSFEPDIVETLKDGMAFGWDFARLNEQDKVKFLKFSPRTSISDLKSELTKLIARYGIKRVCFDPVSVLALNLNDDGQIREQMFELVSLMKRLNVTSIMADESLENENISSAEMSWSKTDIIKFLADSVSVFYESGMSGVSDRAIRITKMRRTSHERKPIGMKLGDEGVEIIADRQNYNKSNGGQMRQESAPSQTQILSAPQQNVPIQPSRQQPQNVQNQVPNNSRVQSSVVRGRVVM